MARYLHRLSIRPARSASEPRPSTRPPVGVGALAALCVLLATSGLAAAAVGRLGAGLHGAAPRGWPATGCLVAAMAPWSGTLNGRVVAGQASLCIVDGTLYGKLDLDHLEPQSQYRAWIAYFESPSLCSAGQLIYQIRNFDRPCTLIDLETVTPHGVLRRVADRTADVEGVLLLNEPVREIDLRPQAQAWLLISRPTWSPLAQPSDSAVHDTYPLARAVLDVP